MKTLLRTTLLATTLLAACQKETPPPAPAPVAPPPAPAAVDPGASSVLAPPREPTPMEQSQAAYLTLQVQEFAAKNGRVPNDLAELVTAKMLPKIPNPPAGMKYVIDPKNRQVLLVRQ